MADVNVTVMVDGKAVFAAGAAGAPDGCACAVAALSLGLAHFQAHFLADEGRGAFLDELLVAALH